MYRPVDLSEPVDASDVVRGEQAAAASWVRQGPVDDTIEHVRQALGPAGGGTAVDFMWRTWQVDAIRRATHHLDHGAPDAAVLINAAVGSGKTHVALAAAAHKLQAATAYQRKVLFLAPLVVLVREQFELLSEYARCSAYCRGIADGPQYPRVTFLAGNDRGDVSIRDAHYVVCTFEHGRSVLAQGRHQMLPGPRFTRCYNQAFQLCVIDEVHHLAGDRGPVLSAVIGMCRSATIPILMLSGTTHEAVTRSLRDVYADGLVVIVNEDDSRCMQVPIRVDDDTALAELVSASVVQCLLGAGSGGWLVFVRTIRELYPVFLSFIGMVQRALDRAIAETDDVERLERMQEIVRRTEQAKGDGDPIPDDLEVRRSGYVQGDAPLVAGADIGQALADERRTAWVAWQLGLAYNWRDLGPWYVTESLARLASGAVHLIVTTSTLATGVNVAGVNHVVLWSTDFVAVEKAQMIGRCGRHQLGFALLRQRDPPSHDAVVKSIAPPLPTADRDVFVWSLLRLAVRSGVDEEANDARVTRRLVDWAQYMNLMPFPTVPERARIEQFRVMYGQLRELRLVDAETSGDVYVTASDNIIRVCQDDSELAPMMARLVSSMGMHEALAACPGALPWVGCLVYWLARRSSLPSVDWQRTGARQRRTNLELLLGPHFQSGVPAPAARIRAWMCQLVTRVAAQDAHWAKPDEVTLGRIADFAVATAWSAFGYVTDWYMYVPREDLAAVIEGSAVYGRAISDFAAAALDYSNHWPPLLAVGADVLEVASHMLTHEDESVVLRHAPTPVWAWALQTRGLVRADVARVWDGVLSTLPGAGRPAWAGALAGPNGPCTALTAIDNPDWRAAMALPLARGSGQFHEPDLEPRSD
jgi:hypothetical protein